MHPRSWESRAHRKKRLGVIQTVGAPHLTGKVEFGEFLGPPLLDSALGCWGHPLLHLIHIHGDLVKVLLRKVLDRVTFWTRFKDTHPIRSVVRGIDQGHTGVVISPGRNSNGWTSSHGHIYLLAGVTSQRRLPKKCN